MYEGLERTINTSFLFTYLIKLNQASCMALEEHSQFAEPDTASV